MASAEEIEEIEQANQITDSSTRDAEYAIVQFDNWISSADTKAGLLMAATTLLGGLLASQKASISTSFHPQQPFDWLPLTAISIAIMGFLVTVGTLLFVLYPRIHHGLNSRYSWPTIAKMTAEETAVYASSRTPGMEAWRTAHALATIAMQKFYWLRLAIASWAICTVGLFVWLMTYTLP